MTLEIKCGPSARNLKRQPTGIYESIEYSLTSRSGSIAERVVCRDSAARVNIQRDVVRHFTEPLFIRTVKLVERRDSDASSPVP